MKESKVVLKEEVKETDELQEMMKKIKLLED